MSENKLFWPDRLRNLATVLVLIIHVASPITQQEGLYGTSYWWAGNLWNSISRPAVPLFIMLSGFLLLSRDYALSDFLKRRFSRVAVPALVWFVVYSFYGHFANDKPHDLEAAFRGIISGPVRYHLWFIYLILGIYLTYPILKPWAKQASERDFMYFFLLCILGTWLYKILFSFFNLRIGLHIELFTNYMGYFILGYYLGNKKFADEQSAVGGIRPWARRPPSLLWTALALIAAGTVLTAVGVWWSSALYKEGVYFGFFYDYLTPNVTFSAIGWFLLIKLACNSRPLHRFESALAATSYGVYLVHVLVMDMWQSMHLWPTDAHPVLKVPGVTIATLAISFTLIYLIRLIPGGTKVT